MLEWFVGLGGTATWEEVPTYEMGAEQIKEAFRVDAGTGRCRSLRARWMLLIDTATEQQRAVACYGNPPPRQLPHRAATYTIDDQTERFPPV